MSDERQHFAVPDGRGLRAAIVAARFNRAITDALAREARRGFAACGIAEDAVKIVRVPGALEIAAAARALVDAGFGAVACLGCVVKGGTDHYEHVSRLALEGIARLADEARAGIGNGVLTVHAEDQALRRVHKGFEAALAAVEMALLLRDLRAT